MKKIFLGLFACIFFLFSCNLEASFGGTDLVIPLPGSEAKIAKYDAGDVASYRVDITRNDGVHYSETGSAGSVIVFENILCGTYTVDIYALDGDTYVAARGSASIEIIKNEENYLSAEAVLQNKVSDFFVSVPKGVWNLDHARYFREKNYYNAVRDVEYGAYETETDGGGWTNVTTAKIVNPDVEYAYLNYTGRFGPDMSVSAGKSAKLSLYFKAEKKCKFSVSMVNSLKEEYGKTLFYEYDPNSAVNVYGNYMYINGFEIGQVDKEWKPLVRICFSKDCGQVSVHDCLVNTAEQNVLDYRYNAAVLPCDKELVSIDIGNEITKFTFDKRKAGSTYTAALFTGMQIEKDKYYRIDIGGVKFNKDVNSLSIAAKSFASKRDLFRSKSDSIQIRAEEEKGFWFIVPGYMIYSDDYEDVYIEIHPDNYEGDILEMSVRTITLLPNDLSQGLGYSKVYIPAYRDLKSHEVHNAPLQITDGNGNSITYVNLAPHENKNISVAVYTNNFYLQYTTSSSLEFGQPISIEEMNYDIPMMLPNVECNVPGLTFYKSEDYKYVLQNNSSCNKIIRMEMNDIGKLVISDVAYNDLKSQYYPENYYADITTCSDIKQGSDYKQIKIASVDAKSFTNMQSFNRITISGISGVPVVGNYYNYNSLDDSSYYYIEVKKKNGQVIDKCSGGVDVGSAPTFEPYYLASFKKLTLQGSPTLDKPFDINDTIVEIYLRYPPEVEGDFITIYDFRAGLEASNY